jgi:hypothetical protein
MDRSGDAPSAADDTDCDWDHRSFASIHSDSPEGDFKFHDTGAERRLAGIYSSNI